MKKKSPNPRKHAANRFPPGWNEARARDLVAHYESQSEDAAVADDEAAFAHEHTSMIEVPDRLVPAVRELLAKTG